MALVRYLAERVWAHLTLPLGMGSSPLTKKKAKKKWADMKSISKKW